MRTKGQKSVKSLDIEFRRSTDGGDSDGSGGCFSDADEQHSWHSQCGFHCAGSSSFDEFRCSNATSYEIGGVPEACRSSCVSEFSADVDLDGSVQEFRIDLARAVEKDCRICHLGLESAAPESGVAIQLGCSCKDDLGAAHKQCAETWFKIRGNKTCEICSSTAKNVVGIAEIEHAEQLNETSNNNISQNTSTETRSFWQGHRFLNFLLACMVFAFVISWLFHFNVPG